MFTRHLARVTGLALLAQLAFVATPARASQWSPTEIGSITAAKAELAAPGFFNAQAPNPPEAVTTPDGVIEDGGVQPTVTIGPSTASGTPITLNGKSYTLSQCTGVSGPFCATQVWSSVTSPQAGTDVLTDAASPASGVVQRDENQVRRMVFIGDAGAPTDYTFVLTGARFRQEVDGVILIVDATSGEVLGDVAPPWGLDANNATVPTSYTVDGYGRLKLTISHVGAAYPVVADPTISLGWYIYVRYSKDFIRGWWPYVKWTWNFPEANCAPIAWTRVNWIVAACVAGVRRYLDSIKNTWQYAYDHYQCMEYRFLWSPLLVGWRNYSC